MLFKKILIQPKSLILIFVITTAIVITYAVIEMRQSKHEMMELMESQGHTLLESLLTSSENALISYEKIESEVRTRLLNNAVMIRTMYKNGLVTNSLLQSIAENNSIYRINIFDKNARKLYSSHTAVHSLEETGGDPQKFLRPIFDGETDTLFIGIKQAQLEPGKRYVVAVSTPNHGAIVLNIDAEELLNYRKRAGFGILLRKLTENKNIEYAALQNYDGIIAASGNVEHFEDFDSSAVLNKFMEDGHYHWRIVKSGEKEIFEGLHPFIHSGTTVGVFRLGLSMDPMNAITDQIKNRIIFWGSALIVFGFITFSFIFMRQNFDILKKRYKTIESYSKQIIDNVNDGIIVLDQKLTIKSVNKAANTIFENENPDSAGFEKCRQVANSDSLLNEVQCDINGKSKILLISKSTFAAGDNTENTVLILKDLTEQKMLEGQIQRKERLASMGELASSVAHEIRNPLNAIGTITQQLNKDFEPRDNVDEYKSLSQLVYKEVKRINETIENFLMFAKPLPLKIGTFESSSIFEQIKNQYSQLLSQKEISMIIFENWKGIVKWDSKQITQVFINLIENAVDSIEINGTIEISVNDIGNKMIEVTIKDDGQGIKPEVLNKIFNLYFTTKPKGSGIGLSIVQKIISEHNGFISAQNNSGKGAAFTIRIPKQC